MSLLPIPPGSLLTAAAGTRPAVILPGLGNNTGDYQGLAMALRERYGIPSVVARVSRFDWLRYAAGLLDANFWKGTLGPRPVLDWYLERVDQAVSEANQLCPRDKGGSISFIGHSAGGWLARIYMEEFEFSHISLLLTLGSPHIYFRPPPAGLPGVIDQTRGLLDYVEKNCAPAVYTPQRKYVCIAGRYIHGATLAGNSDVTSGMTPTIDKDQGMAESVPNVNNNKSISLTPTLRACFIGLGYKQLCGQADVWGDGVVPEMSAHLEGALNMSLDGVCHSPIGSDDIMRPWYGSPSVLEKWVHHLLNP